MRKAGAERVICSLLSYPRLCAKAIISSLVYKISDDTKRYVYEKYMAKCIRLICENVAKLSGGSYIKAEYEDIIQPKKNDERSAREIFEDITKRAGIEVIH